MGVFVVQEFTAAGGVFTENPDGERFEWSASARSVPKKPWTQPGEQRVKRRDYPGARRPSFNILGPKHGAATLEGRWDDKWNTPGFAFAERQRFETMCRRGNPVRITFEQETFDAVITSWEFDYKRASLIGYRFTIDPYGRPEDDNGSPNLPAAPLSADQSFDETNTIVQALGTVHTGVPGSVMTGTTKKDIDTALDSMSANLNKLADVLDTRSGVLKPINEFKKTATMFRIVQGDASNILDTLVSARSDLNLSVLTAMSVLNFDAWSRSMRSTARLLRWKTQKASFAMDERAAPKAIGIYRPRKGESLYSVSRRFYGTPFEWRLIYDRNGLTSMRLTGTERLIIPERGVG